MGPADSNIDLDVFRWKVRRFMPELAEPSFALVEMTDAVRESARLANVARRPADKVAHLEEAKLGLAALRLFSAGLPHTDTASVRLIGDDAIDQYLARLTAIYRSFGFYGRGAAGGLGHV
jgi:hypothetical protein